MRIIALSALGLLGWGIGALAGPAAADDRAYSDHVRGLVAREARRYAAHGYGPARKVAVDATAKADGRRIVLELEGGVHYALIAACDQDCGRVELRLYDAKRALVAKTPEHQSIVSFAGAAGYSGRYEVEIALPGCQERTCHTAFAVLRQDAAAAAIGGTGVAAGVPVAASEPARVAGYAARALERREGFELQADNYRQLRDVTFAGCEQVCSADSRCRAIEYYRQRQSCGLFDRIPAMRAARDIDAGIKRTAVR